MHSLLYMVRWCWLGVMVLDGVQMALLIIYGEVLLVGRDGVGWCANGTPYYIR